MRQGCRSITQLEILPRPPTERRLDNPWPQWPKIDRLDYGQQEALARFGIDPRRFLTTAGAFIADGSGRLRGVQVHEVEWREEGGRRVPAKVPGSERRLDADLALLALGFLGPEEGVLSGVAVERDPSGNLRAEFGRFATSVPGLFAAGDARRGQSLLVWAISEGRGAAREVDRYLMATTDLP
jgi:glutamate synthase (NADPH/NADH) small chain